LEIQTEQTPPYEILSSPGYPPEDLASSRLLAAVTDIFYNRGRAVGFMGPVCQALDISPTTLLERLILWLQKERKLSLEELLATEDWYPAQILPLQQAFLDAELHRHDKAFLQQLVSDLLLYHYHYAETLLGPELLPKNGGNTGADAWHQCWKRSEKLRLVDFNYELDDLLMQGGMGLDRLYKKLTPSGSTGVFLRQGKEILCESLQDDFAKLLKKSNGEVTPAEILPGCDPVEGMELLDFALTEGLLHN
jgi:hypothetical protein